MRLKLPGLLTASAVGLACLVAGPALGGISPLLLAIVLGALVRNILPEQQALKPGLAVAAKSMLRWGVVLLGLQLTIQQIMSLGWQIIVIVVAAVGITFTATLLLGRALKIEGDLTHLIAAGFSICGAAAVAGMQGVIRAREEKVAAALALVVLCGTLMIPASVFLVSAFDLSHPRAGMFIGGSVHEVAQVVAAAGIAGGEALLAIAVPIKLARVAMLAPTITVIAWRERSRHAENDFAKPPLVPLFVVGFVAAMLLASTGLIPAFALEWAQRLQQFLLASAMFALGMGVHVKTLASLGLRPLILAALSTLTIVTVVAAGIALLLPA